MLMLNKREARAKRIFFLTYLNRSGSTFLSSFLDDFKEIAVGIEEDFPDGLSRGKCFIKDKVELHSYVEKLEKSSNKFKFWKLDSLDVKGDLLKNSFPITYSEVLKSLLSLYFHRNPANIWIHKHGEYILYIDQLLGLFPKAKFLFITRDPRAIYLSQISTKDSIKDKPMTLSLDHFTHRYIKYMKQVNIYRKTPKLHVIKYEDLILKEEMAITKLLSFLGVDSAKKNNRTKYVDKIPDSQIHLHRNLKYGPLTENINKWEKKLSKLEIYFIQKRLQFYMENEGYNLKDITLKNFYDRIRYLRLNLFFHLRFYGYRIKKLLKQLNI